MNSGGLSYQKRPREGGTLSVILHTKIGMDMVLGGSRAGERREDDAMGEGQSTDLERCEESRRLGGRRHLSRAEWEERLSLSRDSK
jgi:hypothetical protein